MLASSRLKPLWKRMNLQLVWISRLIGFSKSTKSILGLLELFSEIQFFLSYLVFFEQCSFLSPLSMDKVWQWKHVKGKFLRNARFFHFHFQNFLFRITGVFSATYLTKCKISKSPPHSPKFLPINWITLFKITALEEHMLSYRCRNC